MALPADSVQEFMDIYKEEHGKELPYEQAEEMASELLEFYFLIIPDEKK